MHSVTLLAAAMLAAVATSVGAADLPPRRSAAPFQPAYAPVAMFSWTGFYLGLNAGVGFMDDRNSVRLPAGSIVGSPGTNGTLALSDSRNDIGFVGGGQVGYNWQFGTGSGPVVGIEADFQYADLGNGGGRTRNYTFTGTGLGLAFLPPPATVVRSSDRVDFFGTVRGRLGWAWDRTLFYGTGGLAYGSTGNSDIGWTAGGGVEYAWSNNFTVRLEGLYVDLDQNNNRGAPVYNLATNTLFLNGAEGDRGQFGLVRAAVNYKF
jgi:outer membrane immunogenic protein